MRRRSSRLPGKIKPGKPPEGRIREERDQERERVDARLAKLERENEALRKEAAAERAERLQGFPSQKGQKTRARDYRLDALEKNMDAIGPQVAREVLSQVRGMLGYGPSLPRMKGEAQTSTEGRNAVAPAQTRPAEEEWVLLQSRRAKRERKSSSYAAVSVTPATIPIARGLPINSKTASSSTRSELPSLRARGSREEGKRPVMQLRASKVLPRTRSSVVTVTLKDAARTSYAEVIAKAWEHIPLRELGVSKLEMRKEVTGATVIRVPGDKEREKAAALATKLSNILDPMAVKVAGPIRRAEIKIENIDMSINKEELQQTIASAAGCRREDVLVGDISVARGGLGLR